jgi:hypothetical protein
MPDRDRADSAGVPALTVVMTVYNGSPYVEEAVNSLLAQDFDDFELVIVDDGSTDGTAEALARRTDPRMRLVRRAHAGRVAALNHAVGLARGRYLANLDADDVALPGRLALPVRFLDDHPDVAVVGSPSGQPHWSRPAATTRPTPTCWTTPTCCCGSDGATRWRTWPSLWPPRGCTAASTSRRSTAIDACGGMPPAASGPLVSSASRHRCVRSPTPSPPWVRPDRW